MRQKIREKVTVGLWGAVSTVKADLGCSTERAARTAPVCCNATNSPLDSLLPGSPRGGPRVGAMLAQGGEGALACVRRLGSPVTYRRREGGCPFSLEAQGQGGWGVGGGRTDCFLAGVPQLPARRGGFSGCSTSVRKHGSVSLPSGRKKVKETGHVND